MTDLHKPAPWGPEPAQYDTLVEQRPAFDWEPPAASPTQFTTATAKIASKLADLAALGREALMEATTLDAVAAAAVQEYADHLKKVPKVQAIFWRGVGCDSTVHTYITGADRDVEDSVFAAERLALKLCPEATLDFRLHYLFSGKAPSSFPADWEKIR